MAKICMILTTTKDKKSADKLSMILLRKNLVACIQRISIKSRYMWKNKLQNEREFLLIIKTIRKNRKKIKKIFDLHHPYELPEFVCLKGDSNKAYKRWVERNLF